MSSLVDSVSATSYVQECFGPRLHPCSWAPSGLCEERWTEDVLRNAINSAFSCRTKMLMWSPASQSTMLKPLCCLQGLFLNEAWIGAWLHLFPWLQSKISWGCCLLNDRGARYSVIITLLTAAGTDFSIAPQLHLKWQVTAGFIHLPLWSSPVLAASKGTV